MVGVRSFLDSATVDQPTPPVDIGPLKTDQFTRPKAVNVAEQNHKRIPKSVASMLAGCDHELLDLGGSEPLSLAAIGLGFAGFSGLVFRDCPVYSAGRFHCHDRFSSNIIKGLAVTGRECRNIPDSGKRNPPGPPQISE